MENEYDANGTYGKQIRNQTGKECTSIFSCYIYWLIVVQKTHRYSHMVTAVYARFNDIETRRNVFLPVFAFQKYFLRNFRSHYSENKF